MQGRSSFSQVAGEVPVQPFQQHSRALITDIEADASGGSIARQGSFGLPDNTYQRQEDCRAAATSTAQQRADVRLAKVFMQAQSSQQV